MASIKIEGVPNWEGSYPIDLEHLNGLDHHMIKVIAGVAGGKLEEALNDGDHDVVMAIAACALHRAGRRIDPHQFWESGLALAELGSITLDDEVKDDAGPPALSGTTEESEGSVVSPPSSGLSSNGSSESPARIPSPTGTRV